MTLLSNFEKSKEQIDDRFLIM